MEQVPDKYEFKNLNSTDPTTTIPNALAPQNSLLLWKLKKLK